MIIGAGLGGLFTGAILAKEGFEYRYYIVEDVPTPGEELDGNR